MKEVVLHPVFGRLNGTLIAIEVRSDGMKDAINESLANETSEGCIARQLGLVALLLFSRLTAGPESEFVVCL